MVKSSRKFLLVVSSIALLVVGVSTNASAQTASTSRYQSQISTKISEAKSQLAKRLEEQIKIAITKRVGHLEILTDRINDAKYLTSDHKAQLLEKIGNTRSGLQTVQTNVDVETDLAAMRVLAKSVIEDYRVYLVLTPQVNITTISDSELAMADLLDIYVAKLQAKVDIESSVGKDVTGAVAALDSMKQNIAATHQAIDGVADGVLVLTPQGYPGNVTTLQNARMSLRNAHQYLKAARENAKTIRDFLQAIETVGPSSTTSSTTL